LQLNPLNLISSGTLLITISPKESLSLINDLKKKKIQGVVIGEVLANPKITKIQLKDKTQQLLQKPQTDALWAGLEAPLQKLK
jgi:hydrogenase maturation factor